MIQNDEKDLGGLPLIKDSLERIKKEAPDAILYLKKAEAEDLIPILGLINYG